MAKRKTSKKKVKKNVPQGIAHIQATFNNTLILISDNELKDIKAVAGKISDHVSKCLRQRKKKRIVSA